MYLGAGKYINVSTSSIVVSGNESTGATADKKNNHFYGVYSDNDEGLLTKLMDR